MITVACGSVLMTQRLWHQRALTLTHGKLHPPPFSFYILLYAHTQGLVRHCYTRHFYTTPHHTTPRYAWALWLLFVVIRPYLPTVYSWSDLIVSSHSRSYGKKESSFTLTKMPDQVVLFLDCRQATIQSVHYQLFSHRRGKWGSTWHASGELNFRDRGLNYLLYGVLTVTFSSDLHHTLSESKHHGALAAEQHDGWDNGERMKTNL